jgi:hypothetical protein
MRSLFEMTEGERRGALAGVNLFFAALLGANLGTIKVSSISEQVFLSVLIAGAVAGLFTAAVSSRRSTSIGILAGYAILLAALILVPGIGPGQIGPQLQSLAVTLGVWMGFLVIMRVTPVIHHDKPGNLSIEDDLGTAKANAEERTP